MRRLFSLLLLVFIHLYGDDHPDIEHPLFAGTLLSNYPENTPPGHLSVEPYFFPTQQYGVYNGHWGVVDRPNLEKYPLFLSLETGITDLVDINLIVSESYNHSQHEHAFSYGDTFVALGFQILRMEKETAVPDFRITLAETFPTGKCNDLDRSGVDQSGSGAYETTVTVITEKIFYWDRHHPFDINVGLSYSVSTTAKVRGFNTYGGGPGTKGKVRPGDLTVVNVALEYSLTKHWALGMDIHYEHQNKSSFLGKTRSSVGLPSSEIFSLAPCIEYTWSESLSLAFGYWFSIAGRNINAFRTLGFDVSYYF